ncbi:MAG: hypothetical protein R2748_01050 [Bryobacterales bacterium]
MYLRRLDSSFVEGYVSPQTFQRPEGVEILTRSAQVALVPYREIRAVYFVREFQGPPDADEKRQFQSRPKLDGLWVRLTFHDDEIFEGVIANDLLNLGDYGVTFSPPDANSNTQRVFVPKQTLKELKVLGVIGSAAHRRRARPKKSSDDQIELFS